MKSHFSEPLQQVDRTYVLWRGRKLSYFGGCDYLRMSSHPQVLKAAQEGLESFGLNVAASRRTTGNHIIYERLEAATRSFFKAQSAILVSNGYLTNIVAAQGLKGQIKHAFIDERAHSSVYDALMFLGCPHTPFLHCNAADLRGKLRAGRVKGEQVAVLTDGMFANDGSIPPLKEYQIALGDKGLLWVDDAHAAGILGKSGRGSLELAGLNRGNVIQTITFSKSFGAFGGAVLCDAETGAAIIRKSAVLSGNTPIPPPLANAALSALTQLRKAPEIRDRLWRNVRQFWEQMAWSPKSFSPIIGVCGPKTEALRRELLQTEIHPPLIQYGGPAKSYYRFAISSEHTPEQIHNLTRALRKHLSPGNGSSTRSGLFFCGHT